MMPHVHRFFHTPWAWDGEFYTQNHQQRGLYTVEYGKRNDWWRDVERECKKRVYISEKDIDWWAEPYSYRDGPDVVTGVLFKITREMHHALNLHI